MKLKIKILIIDDEQDYCLIMKHFFESRKYEVHLAHTLTSGREILHNVKPDILLLDNNLPDGEGWNHIEEILEKSPNLQLHLVSAYRSDKVKSFKNDNIQIWEKPISMTKFNEVFSSQN